MEKRDSVEADRFLVSQMGAQHGLMKSFVGGRQQFTPMKPTALPRGLPGSVLEANLFKVFISLG